MYNSNKRVNHFKGCLRNAILANQASYKNNYKVYRKAFFLLSDMSKGTSWKAKKPIVIKKKGYSILW